MNLFRVARDLAVLGFLTYLILTPEAFGRWRADAELAFYLQAETLKMWSE